MSEKTGVKLDIVSKGEYMMGMYDYIPETLIPRIFDFVLYLLSVLLIWIIIITIDFFFPSSL